MMTTEEWNDKTAGEPRADLAQAPAPVRVKPLVWGEKNGAWDARTAFGTGYTVADSQWTYGPPNVWFYSNGGNDAAKAAAQADYTARILAALEAPDAGVVELVEALRLADAALSGANMNMAVVERKVKAALALIAHNTTEG